MSDEKLIDSQTNQHLHSHQENQVSDEQSLTQSLSNPDEVLAVPNLKNDSTEYPVDEISLIDAKLENQDNQKHQNPNDF
jgi:hypothetical protein